MRRAIRAGLLCCAVLNSQAVASQVKVSLRSSWPAPPLLLEIIESVTIENDDAFFPLLDALTDAEHSHQLHDLAPEGVYRFALQTATDSGLLDAPGAASAVEMHLALHAAAPKIEAFYQYYTDVHGARTDIAGKESCEAWVDWYGEVACDLDSLDRLVGHETIGTANTTSLKMRPKTLPFDHIFPPHGHDSARPMHTAILYGATTAPNFRSLHEYLRGLASAPSPRVEYLFRHIPPTTRPAGAARNFLSGYGVSLDLKKMEYSALDDRRTGARGGRSDDAQKADNEEEASMPEDPIAALLQSYPLDPSADPLLEANSPLTEFELLQLGLQSIQLVSDAPQPLETLRGLAQNFPKYATALSRRVTANESVETEVAANLARTQGGVNVAWLNGAAVADSDMSPFALLRLLRKERALVTSVTSLGLTGGEAVSLLSHPVIGQAQGGAGLLDALFDASDRPEGGDVIMWWNDLETDSRYERWSSSLTGLLRPLYPGQFHQVRQNIFNIVLILDLSQYSSLQFIAGAVSNIVDRGFPFHFGLVPVVETQDGVKMAKLFHHLIATYGRAKTMKFIKGIAQMHLPAHILGANVDWTVVREQYELLIAEDEEEELSPTPIEDVVGGVGDVDQLQKAATYARRLAATLATAPHGHVFVNGKHFDLDDEFLRNMQTEASQQLMHIQEQLYSGELDGDASIATYFYDLPIASQRRNQHIYPTSDGLRVVSLPEVIDRSGFHDTPSSFVYPAGDAAVPLTIHLVTDLDIDGGLAFVKEALEALASDPRARLAFVHNAGDISVHSDAANTRTSSLVSHLLSSKSLQAASPVQLLQALGLHNPPLGADESQTTLSKESTLDELLGGVSLNDIDAGAYDAYVTSSRKLVRELGLSPGEHALIVNGRVVGPMVPGEFAAADYATLFDYELRKRVQPVVDALAEIVPPSDHADRALQAHIVASASSIVSAIQIPDPSEMGLFNKPSKPRQRPYQLLASDYTAFRIGDNATAIYHFGIVLDPLSETAQKWTSLLEWVTTLPDVYVEVHLNPARYSELPLKRFYRYNLLPKLSFDDDGQEHHAEVAFADLPVPPIYTLGMDVPPSWLVRPREALHDLDNIQLGHLRRDEDVTAVFDLDYLVVEGHARDTHTSAPPRGVQVQLADGTGVSVDDTQVVANLGYLQFKATPGVFHLEIRAGRGREIFALESVGNEGWDSPSVEEVGDEITLTSFEGLTLYPRFVRRPGMENEDVLMDRVEAQPEPEGLVDSIFSQVTSFFKPKTPTDVAVTTPQPQQADINIFTVASGLLYERFLSIMVVSVLRHTNSTVKFWFIENFLSPSFLEFVPHFAAEYNFQYELVTYKWPSWLRAQKEKQRVIWAYKILFLDVLFPMDLKKVIFVDADQIVRADMKELVDVDLHGAPYGYTPMGDDNAEMEGYRFWKTGYWESFLRGRPYHISALYVVDLARFRQMAAGDMLRGSYQQLSADPHSLANLDQDLPNNLQGEVPIFSLNEDWLWCETWCSKDRLHRAKTIDLCQNPLTKEPKLARARAIPEWEEYDGEIARFTRALAARGLIRSQLTAADVNALAGGAAADAEAGVAGAGGAEAEAEAAAAAAAEGDAEAGHVPDEL